jgi:hypothetical protein
LILGYLIYLNDKKGQIPQVILLIAIGIGSHEIMMIYLLKLVLDSIFNTSIAGGNNYNYIEITFILIVSFVVFVAIRKLTLVDGEGWRHYINFLDRVNNTLIYTKGYINHIVRIYATYGPIFIYSVFHLFFNISRNNYKDILSYGILFGTVAALSLTVADTLRIMSIIIIPIIFLASKYIDSFYKRGMIVNASFLVGLQVLHSSLVFINPSYFKNASANILMVILISLIAFILCLIDYINFKRNDNICKK